LQDIELARISQEVVGLFYKLSSLARAGGVDRNRNDSGHTCVNSRPFLCNELPVRPMTDPERRWMPPWRNDNVTKKGGRTERRARDAVRRAIAL